MTDIYLSKSQIVDVKQAFAEGADKTRIVYEDVSLNARRSPAVEISKVEAVLSLSFNDYAAGLNLAKARGVTPDFSAEGIEKLKTDLAAREKTGPVEKGWQQNVGP